MARIPLSQDLTCRPSANPNSGYRDVKPQYNKVHALILTWEFHDLRLEDYTAKPETEYVSLEQETARLRATLENYGYAVHEYLIPMHRSIESLTTKIKQFCARYEADDTLLIIYYHGHGAMDDNSELVFSRLAPFLFPQLYLTS